MCVCVFLTDKQNQPCRLLLSCRGLFVPSYQSSDIMVCTHQTTSTTIFYISLSCSELQGAEAHPNMHWVGEHADRSPVYHTYRVSDSRALHVFGLWEETIPTCKLYTGNPQLARWDLNTILPSESKELGTMLLLYIHENLFSSALYLLMISDPCFTTITLWIVGTVIPQTKSTALQTHGNCA